MTQLLVPLVLVLWLLVAPPKSRVGFAVQCAGSLVALAVATRVGIWMFPPWWTPYAAATAVVAVALIAWRRVPYPAAVWPRAAPGWIVLLFFVVLGAGGSVYGLQALAAARAPPVAAVALAWPLRGGTVLVANGGNGLLINSHVESFLSEDPRFIPWRGNRWAVDFVAVDAIGLRVGGFMPSDPARYRIFGMPVLAPCAGAVLVAVDGLPDMPVPEYDRANLAGNHVMIACGDVHIAMAHFRQGSVLVKVGDTVRPGQPLGAVGNSGGSNEPHLHIHAQRPGPPGAPMGGEPVPMTFDGRFLVRGDRIDLATEQAP
jgi:hypothetical protein